MHTNYFEIKCKKGNIWCTYDFDDSGNEKGPLVIVAPGYEKTARESLSLASYLVLNGFRVLRFDARNCCGLSSGDLKKFTLTSLSDDIKAVADHAIENLSFNNPISILALSLSARAMLKYLSTINVPEDKIKVAVSIVGVVDVGHTVTQITKEDCFRGYLDGRRYGIKKLLTYDIDYDNFIQDTINNNFLNFETAVEDARKISIPYYGSIMTGDDEWILREHQEIVYNSFRNSHVEQFIIQGATHKIWKNPRSADIAIRNCIRILTKFLMEKDINENMVLKPDITDIIEKNREERKVIFDWNNKNHNLEAANAN